MQSHRDNDSHDREGLCGENRKLIDDLCSGCCSTERYCTLKEILVRAPRDARTLIQINMPPVPLNSRPQRRSFLARPTSLPLGLTSRWS